jgi:uncharacterized protein (DUF4415 family)
MRNNTPFEVILENGQVARGKTDWPAVDALTDEAIATAALSDPEAQLLTESQLLDFRRVADVPGRNILEKSRVLASETKNKQLVSIRYDKDVIAFFRAEGKGYQSLMNSILRSYMEKRSAS